MQQDELEESWMKFREKKRTSNDENKD